ncbi:hypothetical protein [Salmonella enterica]|uniref:hypothetical protein n=1 Tax=Salmonella enterica TaxID=28901 RepID=UPI001592477F|nr:hypothetical protein [Salmonella enterica]EDW6541839.1 hypothetical protein [Salmonella enterica subsp. enterica]EEJ9032792.1 hypothetical protein [Salmonella enterica subsp. enterica serovar Oslo]MBA3214978.1 hypothetical protein [Salmonella enterica]
MAQKKTQARQYAANKVYSGDQSRHLTLQAQVKDTAISRQHQETLWKADRKK